MAEKTSIQSSRNLHRLYVLVFLFTASVVLPIYISSTFLEILTSTRIAGILYSAGSILTILTLSRLPSIAKRYGSRNMLLAMACTETLIMAGLSIVSSPLIASILFVLHLALVSGIAFSFDLFIESLSKEENIGSIRGLALTAANIAWVFSPALAGSIAARGGYGAVWQLASWFLAAVLAGILLTFRHAPNVHIGEDTNFRSAIRTVWKRKNLRLIMTAQFLLQFFFAIMVIYSPIYLHEYIGFGWEKIGLIFSIMLIPFLLLEYPLGRIADRKLGEKELLFLGFLITGGVTLFFPFVRSTDFFLWAGILFATRIGASTVEIMSDTYFFKKIQKTEAEIVSVYRAMRPLAYVTGPLAAAVLLSFAPYRFIFPAVGTITLLGTFIALKLQDTK